MNSPSTRNIPLPPRDPSPGLQQDRVTSPKPIPPSVSVKMIPGTEFRSVASSSLAERPRQVLERGSYVQGHVLRGVATSLHSGPETPELYRHLENAQRTVVSFKDGPPASSIPTEFSSLHSLPQATGIEDVSSTMDELDWEAVRRKAVRRLGMTDSWPSLGTPVAQSSLADEHAEREQISAEESDLNARTKALQEVDPDLILALPSVPAAAPVVVRDSSPSYDRPSRHLPMSIQAPGSAPASIVGTSEIAEPRPSEGSSDHDAYLKVPGNPSGILPDNVVENSNPRGVSAPKSQVREIVDVPAAANMYPELAGCAFGPLNVRFRLTEKWSDVERLLVGAGLGAEEFVMVATFDQDLIPSGVIVEEAHILTRKDLELDDRAMSNLLDNLGLLLSPYRTLISTPSRQQYSPLYLHHERCGYEQLIQFHESQRLDHAYKDLVLTPVGDNNEPVMEDGGGAGNVSQAPGTGANDGGSAGAGGGSAGGGSTSGGQKDDDSNDNGEVTRGDGDGDGGRGSGTGGDDSDPTPTRHANADRVHFKVVFNVQSDVGSGLVQTILVKGSLSSKDTTDVLLPHDMVSACDFQFLELDFEGKSLRGIERSHRQFYANISIDVGRRPFHVGDVKPLSTPSQSNTLEQVQVEECSKGVQAGAAVKNLGPFPSVGLSGLGTWTTKQGSSQKAVIHMNRITQGETPTGVHWGYRVDDPGVAEHGLRLSRKSSELPAAKFTFLGKANGLQPPECLEVRTDSYWTTPEAAIRAAWSTSWVGMFQRRREPILKDLGVRVIFNMASHLTGSWTLERDVSVGGNQGPGQNVNDTYLFGIKSASDVNFSTPSFPVAERARQDPHCYASEQ